MDKMDKSLLNSKEVSQYLSIPLRTLQQLSQQGRIRAIKVGKQWRYKKSDIEEYYNSGTDFSKEPARTPRFLEGEELTERSDRRSYPRINSSIKCQYLIELLPFKNINNEGIIKNIGAGGIFLSRQNEEMNNVDIDDPVSLQFILSMDNGRCVNIDVKGKVIRKTQVGIGMKFRNIPDSTRRIIIQYIG